MEKNNWNDAKSLINENEMGIFTTYSSGGTALHVAVTAGHGNIVEELVEEGKDILVKIQDNSGYTALALAADLTGNTKIAKCMIESRGGEDLLTVETKDGEIPVLLAASKGHQEMTRYLYSKTPLQALVDENAHKGASLLTRCITAEIFDVALSLLKRSTEAQLPLTHESDGIRPLNALANMPSAFPSGRPSAPLLRLWYKILRPETKPQDSDGIAIEIGSHVAQDEGRHKTSWTGRLHGFVKKLVLLKFTEIREIYDLKLKHHLVLEILHCMSNRISNFEESQLPEASAYDAMLDAAKHGIIEFIDSMSVANPDLLWATDKNKRSIFSHAILNRRQWVFRLINDVNERKEMITSSVDAFGNTLLHLAGHLGPSSYLAQGSPTLQMHSEIQWFKKVERIVNPKCREAKNADGKKPRELFSENHKELIRAAEKWTKETANYFALVATLIATITFAAAFTFPGGYNQESGMPIFSHERQFTVFIVFDAFSLLASSTSIVLFLGIVTSRYAETDFLHCVSIKLRMALLALLYSVQFMITAFCAALDLVLKKHKLLLTAITEVAYILTLLTTLFTTTGLINI